MCHVSVGHVARVFEGAGLATVVIGSAPHKDRLAAMCLARSLIVPHPMGRVMGAPHDVERQTEILSAALDLLESAVEVDTMVELPGSYRPTPK